MLPVGRPLLLQPEGVCSKASSGPYGMHNHDFGQILQLKRPSHQRVPLSCCCRVLALVPAALLLLAACASAQNRDIPVATSGFEQWAGVVAKAMAFGGNDKDQTLQAVTNFQAKVLAKLQQKVRTCTRPLCSAGHDYAQHPMGRRVYRGPRHADARMPMRGGALA